MRIKKFWLYGVLFINFSIILFFGFLYVNFRIYLQNINLQNLQNKTANESLLYNYKIKELQLVTKIESLENSINKTQADLVKMVASLQELDKLNKKLSSELFEKNKEASELKEYIANLNNTMRNISDENAKLRVSLEQKEINLNNLSQNIAELMNRIKKLETEKAQVAADLAVQMEKLNKYLQSNSAKKQDALKQVRLLENKILRLENENSALQNQINNLKNKEAKTNSLSNIHTGNDYQTLSNLRIGRYSLYPVEYYTTTDKSYCPCQSHCADNLDSSCRYHFYYYQVPYLPSTTGGIKYLGQRDYKPYWR